MTIYETKEFLKLRNQWYGKLKDSGFEDLEFFSTKHVNSQNSPFLGHSNQQTLGILRRKFSVDNLHHYSILQNFLAHGPVYSKIKEQYVHKSLKILKNPLLIPPKLETCSYLKAQYANGYKPCPYLIPDDPFFTGLTESLQSLTDLGNLDHRGILTNIKDFPKLSNMPQYPTAEIPQSVQSFRTKYRSFKNFVADQDALTLPEELALKFYADGLVVTEVSDRLRQLYKLGKLGKAPERYGRAARGLPYSYFWTYHRLPVLIKIATDWYHQQAGEV